MAMRRIKNPVTPASRTADKSENKRLSNAERSAYFVRREAANVLRRVLEGDARCQAVGSIKSLVYGPSVRNKKGTFALVCQTLKHLFVIKDVLEISGMMNSKWKAISSVSDAEKFLLRQKDALQSALARLLVKEKVNSIEELMILHQSPDILKPRCVRVNTLKIDVPSALHELGKKYSVKKDVMVPHLLILPPGSDLHDHPLVTSGSIFMQGKASSMVAAALDPVPGWEVLDACSAPGNKTVHLAALMKGRGKIIACELDEDIEVRHGDFLNLDPKDPSLSKVRAILLDPSCSGSGTAATRLDHLIPSHSTGDAADVARLNKLAAFQRKALSHALSFPEVERLYTAHAPSIRLKMKPLSSRYFRLLHHTVFSWHLPFPSGSAVASQSSKALNTCFGRILLRTKRASSLLCL